MDVPSPPDPLRLSNCPGCGYALEGLAAHGNCPECGDPYDQSVVVLHGFGAGRQSSIATARPREAAITAGVYAIVLCFWIVEWRRKGRLDAYGIIWLVALLAWLVGGLWKRWRTDMPGLAQVWLGADGVRQVNNPIPGSPKKAYLIPWREVKRVTLRPAGHGTFRIEVKGPTSFWRSTDVTVDAEVRCTPEQAATLELRIAAWRGEPDSATSAGAA